MFRQALRMRVAFALFALLVGQAHSEPARQVITHHVPRPVLEGQLRDVGTVAPAQQLALAIHMPVRNPEALAALIKRQSDPRSTDYRHWLTVSQFTERFGRTQDEYDRLVRFALTSGLTVVQRSPNRLILGVRGSSDLVQKVFHVNLRQFQHPKESRTFFAPDREPSVATDVPISHISGLNNYWRPRPLRRHMTGATLDASGQPVGTGSGANQSFIGSDIRTAYSMGPNVGTGQSVALVEFAGYAASDISMFLTNTHLPATVPLVNIAVGGGTPTNWKDDDGESECAMDIEWVLAIAPGLKQLLVYVGPEAWDVNGTSNDGLMLSQIATDNLAKVISSSWVWWPDDPSVDEPYFQEMAAQGQTYLQSSGDYGSYGGDDSEDESYPGEDPYVTTVGGTTLTTVGAGGPWQSEVVWNDGVGGSQIPYLQYGSGGGIANDGLSFPIPSWQGPVISTANGGSTTVRNVPDIAMESDFDSYECTLGYCDPYGNGTSIATPRWAGYVALVNQQLVANGQPAGLGLLAPQLYAIGQSPGYASAFNDIVLGNNYVYAGYPSYSAVPGYDLTTGWGSMNGQGLMAALAGPAVPSFGVYLSPASALVVKGHQAAYSVLINGGGGFSQPVSLGVAGQPRGMSTTISPNPTSTTATLTAGTKASEATGSSTLVLSAASPGAVNLTGDVAFTVEVVDKPTLSTLLSPAKLGLPIGGSISSDVTVTSSNSALTSAVLQVTGLPDGVSANFSPNPINFVGGQAASSLLTLTSSPTGTAGSSSLVVVATSQLSSPTVAINGNAQLALAVELHPFLLSVSPSSYQLQRGAIASAQINVKLRNGYTAPITLTLAGLPDGVTASFGTNPMYTATTLTLNIGPNAKIGATPLTIKGTSGGLSSQTILHLRVER